MSKVSYQEELNKIVSKYGYNAESLLDSKMIFGVVMDIIHTRCYGKKISIWGVGKSNTINSHAAILINQYILELGSMEELIDSSTELCGKEFLGYPIILPEQIKERGIEIVIIASRASSKSIINSLMEIAPWCEYVDIYEELRLRGIFIDYNFFSEQNIYTELYRLREKYEKADKNQKQPVLQEIIKRYLEIKDFHYAKKFASIYCENQYEGFEEVKNMFREIESLVVKIKEVNQQKKQGMIIHLIDSLRACDIYANEENEHCLNIFKNYEKDAVIFREAYSTGPTTYESMMGVIKQKLSYEENVYEDGNFMFRFEDFEVLKYAEQKNMPITFYVAKDYLIMEENVKIVRKEQLHMSEKLWELACDVAQEESPGFHFLYYPWELHFPLLCGFHQNTPKIRHFSDVGIEPMEDFIEQQFADCLDYVDKQFEYYSSFFSREIVQIFLGDHSQPVFDCKKTLPYFAYCMQKDKVSHVAFIVCSSKLKSGKITDLVSLLDFNKILKSILMDYKIEFPHREIVQYQYYKIQNKKLRDVAIKEGFQDYIDGMQCFLSKEYIYVITATKKEYVYKLNNLEQNIRNCSEGIYFSEKVKKEFNVDFPKFVVG